MATIRVWVWKLGTAGLVWLARSVSHSGCGVKGYGAVAERPGGTDMVVRGASPG